MNTAVPLISSLVSLVFALAVFDQYLGRRKPHQLVWSIGFLMYFLSTGSEFVTGVWGLNAVAYRIWYLCGAIYVAAYLGMGTVYLLFRGRRANIAMSILGVASIYALIAVIIAPIDLSAVQSAASGAMLSGQGFPASVRIMTPFFNTFGTVALVGGAAYSAWIFWRKRILPHRVVSNILIAVGAILPAFGGALSRFGLTQVLYYLELAGVVIIFIGFLRSREIFGLFRIPFSQGFSRVAEKA